MVTPSGQLTLTKGNKSWSSTAGAAALENSGSPWLWTLAVTHCGRLFIIFFFFFFFFYFFFFYFTTAWLNTQFTAALPKLPNVSPNMPHHSGAQLRLSTAPEAPRSRHSRVSLKPPLAFLF
eukprot:FR735432.1.p2 GENE.FR735432.1~~FR735432.1.p2  ORF type:complete len:121 (-),score=32.31 FR735432.1:311-673(-)